MSDFVEIDDVIVLPTVQGKERLHGTDGRVLHPAQKPEQLLRIIITASSHPGDLVLDPFAGTGTTLVVSAQLGRRWIGIEAEPRYYETALKRLRAVQPSIPAEQCYDNPSL